ncbi:hypothetical protein ARMGADRAFT_1073776 [Armillaria gallica]|uniref:Uncharacterized protein n=1 Tax=Armillaria gallica TaxID=47427 RepID=A0A2H3ECZ3_ARMGA|nr:hypothetical protein ARMGADRAFT_1073776 [Armillaria gallica]
MPPTMYDDCDPQCPVHLNPSPFDSSPYFTDSTFDVCHLCNNLVRSFHPKHEMDASNPSSGKYPIPRQYGDHIPCMSLVDDIKYCSFYRGDLSLCYFYDDSAECLLGDELITLPFVVRVFRQDRVLAWHEIWKALHKPNSLAPARYNFIEVQGAKMGQGPCTAPWFKRMVCRFTLDSDNCIVKRGSSLQVCIDSTEFEFKSIVMYDLKTVIQLTPVQLVDMVQTDTQHWHIDALRRAEAIIHDLQASYFGIPASLIPKRLGGSHLVVDLRH